MKKKFLKFHVLDSRLRGNDGRRLVPSAANQLYQIVKQQTCCGRAAMMRQGRDDAANPTGRLKKLVIVPA